MPLVRRVLAAGTLVLLAVVTVGVAPAAAHSVLVSTSPAQGATVASAPDEIRLRFDADVEVSLGAVRLFDAGGEEIPLGAVRQPGGVRTEVVASVPSIGRGSYVVSWRVVSADGHPVNGAFTFAVGSPGGGSTNGLVTRLLADSGSAVVATLFGVARWATFLLVAVVVGAMVMAAYVWPETAGDAEGLLRRAAVAGALVSIVAIGLQGAYTGGFGLSAAFRPSIWSDVVGTRFGQAALIRAALLALAVPLAAVRHRVLVGVWALGVLATITLSGHAITGRWVPLAVVADLAHLAAMSLWVGGLALAAAVVLRHRSPDEAYGLMDRFSPLAFGSVVTLIVTGTVQGVRQSGTPGALFGTTYGRLLLLKSALVLVVIGLAWLSRRGLRRRAVGRLARTVVAELSVIFGVLAVTSLLSATIPAIEAQAVTFRQTVVTGDGFAEVWLDPARSGTTALHVTMTNADGSLPQLAAVTVELRLPARDIGPLDDALGRYQGLPNHFTSDSVSIPFPGLWEVTVRARIGDFLERVVTVNAPVR